LSRRPLGSTIIAAGTRTRRRRLLAGLSEEQISDPQLADNWSIKDISASFLGTVEHHQEHMDTLLAWLREHGRNEPPHLAMAFWLVPSPIAVRISQLLSQGG